MTPTLSTPASAESPRMTASLWPPKHDPVVQQDVVQRRMDILRGPLDQAGEIHARQDQAGRLIEPQRLDTDAPKACHYAQQQRQPRRRPKGQEGEVCSHDQRLRTDDGSSAALCREDWRGADSWTSSFVEWDIALPCAPGGAPPGPLHALSTGWDIVQVVVDVLETQACHGLSAPGLHHPIAAHCPGDTVRRNPGRNTPTCHPSRCARGTTD